MVLGAEVVPLDSDVPDPEPLETEPVEAEPLEPGIFDVDGLGTELGEAEVPLDPEICPEEAIPDEADVVTGEESNEADVRAAEVAIEGAEEEDET